MFLATQAQMQAIAAALWNVSYGVHHDVQIVMTDGEHVVRFECPRNVNEPGARHSTI